MTAQSNSNVMKHNESLLFFYSGGDFFQNPKINHHLMQLPTSPYLSSNANASGVEDFNGVLISFAIITQ